jgi:hypothetical protein
LYSPRGQRARRLSTAEGVSPDEKAAIMTRPRKTDGSAKTNRLSFAANPLFLAASVLKVTPPPLLILSALILLSPACSDRPDAAGAAPSSAPVSAGASPDSDSLALPVDFPSGKPYFVRIPARADWSKMNQLRKPPRALAYVRKWGPFYDLRQTDLGRLDLKANAQDLLTSFFDTETKWPAALPPPFDPAKILDVNRNPGLGLRELHVRGFTGKGVSVAVIDTPFLLDHEEYADRLRFYGEVNAWGEANFHGTLVTSILAGRACGVAPEAEIYYVGSHNYDISPKDNAMVPNATHCARAIDELLRINARLPREKRIRVISVSAAWGPKNPGFKAANKAVQKASEAGIFVVSWNVAVEHEPGFWFWGLDRAASDSPDDPASYRVISWKEWISQIAGRDGFEKFYEKRLKKAGAPEFLLISESAKTVAHPFGLSTYGFYPMGGWSSVLPYIVGLYALACQVKPDITPEGFWRAALATGDPMPIKTEWATYAGKRVNPTRLVESLR